MLVTRIGDNCTLVMNGDIRQSDIKEQSGLSKAIHLAKKYSIEACVVEFGIDDVVRSDLCKQWLEAFYKENL
jgi:phosphate starvation-inducible PhoH-like protein